MKPTIKTAFLPALLILLLAGFTTAQVELGVTISTRCASLTSSSTLSSNVQAAGSCFVFNADSITLDCNGYNITGNGNGAGVNATGRKNIIIKNCGIRNFTVGINFTKTNYSDITNNRVWNNSWYGVMFTTSNSSNITSNNIYNSSSSGVYLSSSHNNSVSSNNVYNGSSNGISIFNSHNNSVSLNNISYNWVGLYVSASDNHSIHSNRVFNNSQEGISLWNSNTNNSVYSNTVFNNTDHGIYLFSSPDNTVHHNTVFSQTVAPGGQRGIYIYYSHRNLVYSNNVSNNTYGIEISYSNWANVSSNNLSVRGSLLLSYSNHSHVHSNIMSKSISYGIWSSDAYNNSIYSNNISNCSSGLYIFSSFNNSFSFNRVINSTEEGAYVYVSNGNNFTNDSLEDNQRHSFYFRNSNNSRVANASISGVPSGKYALNSTDGSHNNTVLNTTFDRIKIYNDATSNLTVAWFARVHFVDGNGANVDGGTVTVTDALGSQAYSGTTDSNGLTSWFTVNDTIFGFSPKYYNNTFTATKTGVGTATNSTNVTYSQQIELGIGGCRSLSNSVTLSSNVQAAGSCFVFNADSITLDCNGYNVTGNGIGAGVNATGRKNLVIRNCNIRNFTVGINFTKTNYSDITNNRVWNNSELGVYFTNSNSSNITSNNIHNNTVNAIWLSVSHDNSISGNNVSNHTSSSWSAILLRYSNSNSISSNFVYNNTRGLEVFRANNNTFSYNHVTNNSIGINVWDSNFTTVFSNNVSTNLIRGIRLESALYGNVSSNIVSNNSIAGIGVYSSSDNNTFSFNNVSRTTGWGGFEISGSHNNSFYSNSISNSSQYGIRMSTSHNNSLYFNSINASSIYGFYASQSHNNSIHSNNVSYNSNVGIYLTSSRNNSIHSNRVFNNSHEGITLGECTNNSVYSNTVFNNTDHGIYLFSSPDNKVYLNTVLSQSIVASSPRGIYVQSSPRNLVYANNVSGNVFGINIHQSNWVNVSSNNITSNPFGGLLLTYCNNSFVHFNTLSSNSLMGLEVGNSYNNSVFSNNLSSNTRGLYVDYSFNNSFYFNNITSSTYDGVYIIYSKGNNFTNETLSSNGWSGFYFQNSNDSLVANSSISGVPSGKSAFNSTTGSNNNTVLNTTFDRSKIFNDATSNLTLQWYVRVRVRESIGLAAINNANVTARNAFNSVAFSENTSSDGITPTWQIVNDSTLGFSPKYYNYHAITSFTETATSTASRNISSTGIIDVFLGGATCGVLATNVTLSANISATSTCLSFTSDFLSLDCNNHTITGNGIGAGINASGRKNVTIQNCRILNFTTAINLTDSNYSIILNNEAYNNSKDGISLVRSNSNNITNNTLHENYDNGLRVHASTNNSIQDNTARNNSLDGFTIVTGSENNTLSFNFAYNNSQSGVSVSYLSHNNTLTFNTAYNNSFAGFTLAQSSSTKLFNNTAYSNTADGFSSSGSSDFTNFTQNFAFNNSQNGFKASQSRNNLLYNNTAYYNSLSGALVSQSLNASLTLNNLTNNTLYGLSVYLSSHNATITSNNASYNSLEGMRFYSSRDCALYANNIHFNALNGVIATANSKLSITDNNEIQNNSRYGLASIDSNITVNSTQLEENALGKSLFAWSVKAGVIDSLGDVVFDSGVSVSASGSEPNSYTPSDYTAAMTGLTTNVQGFTPIFLVRQNYTANDSTASNYNPQTFTASKGTASGTNVTPINYTNNETGVYIQFTSSFCNTCSTCDSAVDSQWKTIQLQADLYNPTGTCVEFGASNVILECNGHAIYGLKVGDGVKASSKNNVSIRNCVIHHFDSGINFTQTTNSFIINNTLYNNSQGAIISTSSTGNLLENNTAFNSTRAGYNVSTASTSNTLNNNTAYYNNQGFYLSSNSLLLENNTARNNTANGFAVYSSSSTMRGNTAFNNTLGIDLAFSSNTLLANNTAYYNLEGLRLSYSTYNTIANNSFYNNSQKGISLYSTEGNIKPTGNNINSNLIENNSLGVYFVLSLLNNFNSNTINNNTNGVLFLEAHNNTIDFTTISNSANAIIFQTSDNNTVANSTITSITGYAFHSSSSDPRFTLSNTALNTSFESGRVSVDSRTQLYVKWFVRALVLNSAGMTPISGATATVKNNGGGTIATSTTDSDGYTIWNTVTDSIYRGTGNSYYNNHSLTGSLGADSATVSKNVSSSMTVNIPIGAVSCGTLTTNAMLNSDISATSTCFTLAADNIILDCNGRTITRVSGSGSFNGIQALNLRNITIRNCIVRNFTNGIYLENTNLSTLYRNTAQNNTHGFNLSSSSNNSILENILVNNSHTGVTLHLQSSNNTVENNTARDHTQVTAGIDSGVGIYAASPFNFIRNNSLKNNVEGIYSRANNNTFSFNYVNNCSNGIRVTGHNNTLYNNTILNSSSNGVFFKGAKDNLLVNSTINNSLSNDVKSTDYSNNTALNNSLNRATFITMLGALPPYKINNDATSNLTLQWLVQINATDLSNAPLEGAQARAWDKNNNLLISTTSVSNGLTPWFTVTDAILTSSSATTINYNNHTLNASASNTISVQSSKNISSTQRVQLQVPVAPLVSMQVLVNGVDTSILENSGQPYNITIRSNGSGLRVLFNETNGYVPFALPQSIDSNVRNYAVAETTTGGGNVSFTVIPTGGQYADASAVGAYKNQLRIYYSNILIFERNYTVTNRNLPLTSSAVSIPNRPNILSINDNILRLYDRVKTWNGGENHPITIYTDGTSAGTSFTVVAGKPAGLSVTVRTPGGAPVSNALVRVIETNGYQPWAMTQVTNSNVTNYAFAEATTASDGNVRITILPTGGVQGFDSFVGAYKLNMSVTLADGTRIYSADLTNSDRLLPEPSGTNAPTYSWNNVRALNDEVMRVYDRAKGYLSS
ncbi:right-handed parallel beta-helix repeat-containing protein [Candidatus Micrarchaeota archaeon]|nr:right-handed parallel beta-helix repeat-containing protein [Candidatus Micrarchaeota archaeon]